MIKTSRKLYFVCMYTYVCKKLKQISYILRCTYRQNNRNQSHQVLFPFLTSSDAKLFPRQNLNYFTLLFELTFSLLMLDLLVWVCLCRYYPLEKMSINFLLETLEEGSIVGSKF